MGCARNETLARKAGPVDDGRSNGSGAGGRTGEALVGGGRTPGEFSGDVDLGVPKT
jgi:hypothetical protein